MGIARRFSKHYKLAPVLVLGGAATVLIAPLAHASAIDALKPHRAVYDVKLEKASDRSGIRAMDGRIVYEIKGSRCEGFAVRFRFLTRVRSARKTFTSDQRNATFESGDGTTFNFSNQSYLNEQLESSLQGVAKRGDDGVEIEFSKPDAKTLQLDDAVFLTQHVTQMLEAAKREQTFLTARVYDASEGGNNLVDTTAVIGKSRAGETAVDDEDAAIKAKFEGEPGWPVSVSYFGVEDATKQVERTPDYQVSFILQESGVSRRLKMTYPDYSLSGKLTDIEFFESTPCE
ncbi:MAG: DUF1849 family protein [Pseudomonadota bacterium]